MEEKVRLKDGREGRGFELMETRSPSCCELRIDADEMQNIRFSYSERFQKNRSLLREETKMDVEIDKQENLVLPGVTNNFDCKNVKLECDEIEKQENSFDYSTKSQFNSAIKTEYIGKSLS